jgi:hypothetical protein
MISRASTIVILALALGAGPASAALPQGNLIQNPGAETFQDWVPGTGLATVVEYGTPGGFPSTAEGAFLGGGMNFFAGGLPDKVHGDPSTSSLFQTYNVPTSAGQEIDSGGAVATIGGCFGGYLSQNDSAGMSVDFLFGPDGDRAGSSLSVGGPTAAARGNLTRFVARAASAAVPARTRTIFVKLEFDRASGPGTYNDGYADNVVLMLTPAGSPPPTVSCAPPPSGGGGSGGGGGTGGGGTGSGGGGTGGGGTGGGGTPRSQFPVLPRSKSAQVSRSAISVRLTCDAHDAPCAGKIALAARGLRHGASVKLGSAKFSVAASMTKTVRVRVGRHARRRLAALSKKQLRRVRLTAKVTVGSRSTTFPLRLKR